MKKSMGFIMDDEDIPSSTTTPLAEETKTDNAKPQITGNSIYFYGTVNRDNVLILNKAIDELNNKFIAEQAIYRDAEPHNIYLYINSLGGAVFSGLGAMDRIASSICPIITIVDGIAASAATFMSVAGSKRIMRPNSVMLIHQIWSFFWGKYAEWKDEMENMDKMMSILRKVYNQHTNIPSKKLDEILKHDLLFGADECIKYGLVDEIANI